MNTSTDLKAFFPQFSFFRKPVYNQIPYKNITPFEIYLYITGNYAKESTLKLREIGDKKLSGNFKCTGFDYACFSGTFSTRNEKGLMNHSGLICLDFDEITDREKLREKLLADPFLSTVLLFTSPSGTGLKWIVKINNNKFTHKEYFNSIENYIFHKYKVKIDTSGKDVARACFIPYDPECVFMPSKEIKNFEVKEWLSLEPQIEIKETPVKASKPTTDKQKTFEVIVNEIISRGIDITGDYYQWQKIGFAIVSEFGESGRKYFHSISKFYPGYNENESNKQYTAFLKHNGQGITIKTFYYTAKQFGIKI